MSRQGVRSARTMAADFRWQENMAGKFSPIKALVFDVFGTVVDWRGSIIREMRSLARAKKLGAVSAGPSPFATGVAEVEQAKPKKKVRHKLARK